MLAEIIALFVKLNRMGNKLASAHLRLLMVENRAICAQQSTAREDTNSNLEYEQGMNKTMYCIAN